MTSYPLPDLAPALPELWLAALALALVVVGVFAGKDKATGLLSWLAGIGFAIAAVLIVTGPEGRVVTFNGMFVTDSFGAPAGVGIGLGESRFLKLRMWGFSN